MVIGSVAELQRASRQKYPGPGTPVHGMVTVVTPAGTVAAAPPISVQSTGQAAPPTGVVR